METGARHQSSFRFKDLPPEVRYMIYKEYINITKPITTGKKPLVSASQWQLTAIFAVDRFTSEEALSIYYQRSKRHISFNMFKTFRWPSKISQRIGRMKHIDLEIFSPRYKWSDCPAFRMDQHDRKLGKVIDYLKTHALSLSTYQLSILTPEWPDAVNHFEQPTTTLVENGFTANALRALCQQLHEITIVGTGHKDTLSCLRRSMAPESAWDMTELQTWPHPWPWPECTYGCVDERKKRAIHIRAWRASKLQPTKMETLKKAGRIMVVGGSPMPLQRVERRYHRKNPDTGPI